MKEVYLVLEYESGIIYLPFCDLESVDALTVGYSSPLDLCALVNDFLELGIPRDQMLDAYLSDSVNNVYDDMQEYNKRYLAVKYRNDNYDINDLKIKFINYIKYNKQLDDFVGLEKVISRYKNKYAKNRLLIDRDFDKIALAYLGDSYKRSKECFFKLKDKGYRTKINHVNIHYHNMEELNNDLQEALIRYTNMTIPELKEYVYMQREKGMGR